MSNLSIDRSRAVLQADDQERSGLISNVRLPTSGEADAEHREPDTTTPPVPALPAPAALMETLRRFERAHSRQSIEDMRACFHDEALIESVASYGQPLG